MKLSVITICLNDREGLRKTIQSVFDQTFRDFEYIVIDGGSKDGSADLIMEHAGKFAYHVSEKDNGIYHAMNKGIDKAKGEYLLFLNAGDFLYNEHVLANVFSLEREESILYGDMIIDYGDRQVPATQPDKITFEFMVLTTIWHPVSFIKRKLFGTIGRYNEELRIVSDFEFLLKAIMLNKESYFHLPFVISVFNTKGVGSDPKYQALHDEERKKVLLRYFPKKDVENTMNYNLLKRSRISAAADGLRKFPLVMSAVAGIYRLMKSNRKLFRS